MSPFSMLLLKNKETLLFLRKSNSRFFLVLILIFSNYWIYRILNEDLLIGLVLIVVSLVSVLKPLNAKLLILAILVLLFFQFQTTHIKDLKLLDNDQQRVQQERIRSYPLIYINVFPKVIWLKPEIWIEQNNFVIALSRIEKNLFENLDVNQYFFSGFPRNNTSDFQKFPFIILPFFVLGIFGLLKEKQYKLLILFFLTPVIFLSFIGNDNGLGPFSLFPFFIITFVSGIELLSRKFNK